MGWMDGWMDAPIYVVVRMDACVGDETERDLGCSVRRDGGFIRPLASHNLVCMGGEVEIEGMRVE